MRKKFKLTVFAIASILAVTACAGKEKAQTTAPSESVAVTKSSETIVESLTESDKKNESAKDIGELKGVADGNVYTNKALNIKFDAAANNMNLAGEEELSAIGQESPEGYMDMYAYDSAYTKIAMLGILNPEITDIKAYMEKTVEEQKKINEEYKVENAKLEITTTKLLGEDVPCIYNEVTSGDVTQYNIQAFIKSGDRIVNIVYVTTDANLAKTGMDMFTKAE